MYNWWKPYWVETSCCSRICPLLSAARHVYYTQYNVQQQLYTRVGLSHEFMLERLLTAWVHANTDSIVPTMHTVLPKYIIVLQMWTLEIKFSSITHVRTYACIHAGIEWGLKGVHVPIILWIWSHYCINPLYNHHIEALHENVQGCMLSLPVYLSPINMIIYIYIDTVQVVCYRIRIYDVKYEASKLVWCIHNIVAASEELRPSPIIYTHR